MGFRADLGRLARLVITSWLALASTATAQESVAKVVVLRFEGSQNEEAREAVLIAIASYYELISEERAIATAAEIGVDVTTPEGMQQVVEHLGITMVVAGSVEGRGVRAVTTILVLDSAGNELTRHAGPAPTDRHGVGEAGLLALQEAENVLHQREEDARLEAQRVAEAEAAALANAANAAEEQDPEASTDQPETGFTQRLLVLLSGLRIRNADSYVIDAGNRTSFYAADFYPEIDLHATVRPLVNDTQIELRGLLFALSGSFSIGMNYVRADGVPQGMTSLAVRLDVGYGYTIAELFEIIGMIGVGVDGVLLEAPDAYASAIYTHLRPAVMGRLRAHEDFVIVEAGLGARIGLDAGPLAGAYGPSAFAGGADLFVGLFGRVDLGLSWAARIGFTHYALSFNGDAGALANGRSGVDQAFDFRFLLGYSL